MELNIFTDASITKTNNDEVIGCAGAIALEGNNIYSFEVLRDSTNNISEITAIQLAVQLAIQNRQSADDIVHIWSDSQWAVFGLTKWIKSWVANIHNNILMSSSGEPVKNQHIFLSIIKLIIDYRLRVNFYHIKGHINTNDIKSVNNAVEVFNRSNNASISRDKIYIAAQMNNRVDYETRNILKDFRKADRVYLTRGIINPIIEKPDLNIYYNLVTLGGNKI